MTCWAPWFRKNWAVSPFPAPTSRTVPSTPFLGRYTRCHCFNSSFRIFLWGGSSFRFAKSRYSHIVSASYLTADNRIQSQADITGDDLSGPPTVVNHGHTSSCHRLYYCNAKVFVLSGVDVHLRSPNDVPHLPQGRYDE